MESNVLTVDEQAAAFYGDALTHLERAGIRYLIGGAYAFAAYSKIVRNTKDLDVFLRPDDVRPALEVFRRAGYDAELLFPHWLGKVHSGEHFIDVIFSSGNGVARVDDIWFERSVESVVLDRPIRLCPPEEMIWSKAYVQERERFDGADVLHLIRAIGHTLDWDRLMWRFGDHWRVLLSFVVLFGFVYPDARCRIPSAVLSELLARLSAEGPEPDTRVCYGTLLSREQYLVDLARCGYEDARLQPLGRTTPEELEIWTNAIDGK